MYSDDKMMTYGKYKFWRLKDIPAHYFLTIWESQKGGSDKDLKEWIEANLERLKANPKDLGTPPPIVPFICNKRTFPTKKDAQNSLKKIRTVKGDNKKPLRSYECPICSGWHLTSKEIDKFK